MLKSFRSGPGRASSPAPSEPASLGGLRTQDSPVSAASFIIANDFLLNMLLLPCRCAGVVSPGSRSTSASLPALQASSSSSMPLIEGPGGGPSYQDLGAHDDSMGTEEDEASRTARSGT